MFDTLHLSTLLMNFQRTTNTQTPGYTKVKIQVMLVLVLLVNNECF